MTLDNATVNSRLVVILIIIVGLISAVGVIISAVALGRPSMPSISISQTGNSKPLVGDFAQQSAQGQPSLPVIPGLTPAPPSAGPSSTPKDSITAAPGSGTVRRRDVHNMMRYPDGGGLDHKADTVWTLAVGYDKGPHEYRDESGSIQGFSSDIVNAVCDALGIECRLVYDTYQNCWTTTPNHYPSGGKGLLGQWYDACVGWVPSSDRLNVFDFSTTYARSPKAKLYIKKGDVFDLHTMKGKKIGLIQGFAEDEQCLHEQNAEMKLPPGVVVYIGTPQEAAQYLRNGMISAVFAADDVLAPYLEEDLVPVDDGEYTCTKDGYAIMTRKDNNFMALWNNGFQQIKENGLYDTICEQAKKHGQRGTVKCLEK